MEDDEVSPATRAGHREHSPNHKITWKCCDALKSFSPTAQTKISETLVWNGHYWRRCQYRLPAEEHFNKQLVIIQRHWILSPNIFLYLMSLYFHNFWMFSQRISLIWGFYVPQSLALWISCRSDRKTSFLTCWSETLQSAAQKTSIWTHFVSSHKVRLNFHFSFTQDLLFFCKSGLVSLTQMWQKSICMSTLWCLRRPAGVMW